MYLKRILDEKKRINAVGGVWAADEIQVRPKNSTELNEIDKNLTIMSIFSSLLLLTF
jgi:hypothetical protein